MVSWYRRPSKDYIKGYMAGYSDAEKEYAEKLEEEKDIRYWQGYHVGYIYGYGDDRMRKKEKDDG